MKAIEYKVVDACTKCGSKDLVPHGKTTTRFFGAVGMPIMYCPKCDIEIICGEPVDFEQTWKRYLTKKPHLNLCKDCRHLGLFSPGDIKNSNLADSAYDNGKGWMECGCFNDIGMLPDELLITMPDHWGKTRCADFEREETEECD